MLIRCSARQLAEAVILWSVEVGGSPILCMEKEDADDLKDLDLFISTVDAFKGGFDRKFEIAFDKHKKKHMFSKNEFVNYLKPRCLLLAENNGCFDLLLTCGFFSHAVLDMACCNGCCHLSRVACKILTTVLEEKFTHMFTDSGWTKLMSYCRKIHDVVFPSRENRPPGHHLNEKKDEEPENPNKDRDCDEPENPNKDRDCDEPENPNKDRDCDEPENPNKDRDCDEPENPNKDRDCDEPENCEPACKNEITENKLIHNEDLDQTGKNAKSKLISKNVSNDMVGQASDSPVIVHSTDDESSDDDDSVYWDYETMGNLTICERVANSQKHLTEVFKCLDMLKEDMDPESVSSNKYNIPVSDDEDIKKLEKREHNDSGPEYTIQFSDEVVETMKKEICEKKNEELGDSSLSPVNPEDITDDEIFEHFAEKLCPPEDEPQCELCDGKMAAYKRKWIESYREKYSNHELVSDVI